MTAPSPSLDPVSAITAVLVGIVGPTMAPIVGAYVVILLASSTGAGWALSRREPGLRSSAAWFMLRINGSALALTWGLAKVAQAWVTDTYELTWMLAPIALVIGAIGDDWQAIGRWLLMRVGRFIQRRIDGGQP